MKFYLDKTSGNIVVTTDSTALPTDAFTPLTANSTDAAQEKHVPVAAVKGNTVTVDVGSVAHPMTEAHLISCVVLETNKGYAVKYLSHTDSPKAEFALAADEKPIAAYGYCNLHGLWLCRI